MSAFDSAWGLLKMPIVPGSIRPVETDEDYDPEGMRRFSALFKDPKTGDEHTMRAVYHPKNRGSLRPPNIGVNLGMTFEGDESWADFKDDSRHGGKEGDYSSVDTVTRPPYRRRGYATALYDMAAAILAKYGKRVVPSIDQTHEGMDLWNSKVDFDDGEFAWPVRDDL